MAHQNPGITIKEKTCDLVPSAFQLPTSSDLRHYYISTTIITIVQLLTLQGAAYAMVDIFNQVWYLTGAHYLT
jgi:hypothetical protein